MRRIPLWVVLLGAAALTIGCAGLTVSADEAAQNPGAELFRQHGWVVTGAASETLAQLPPDFTLQPGSFPWVVYLDLSRDIGLDFTAHAGEEVRVLRFPVEDEQGGRLEEIAAQYDLQGMAVLAGDQVVGAWLTYTARDGTPLRGSAGYSLKANDLEQVTGLQWPEYAARHRPDGPDTAAYLSAPMASRQFHAVTISYPENFAEPFEDSQGGLVLRFATGDIRISRAAHASGRSLSETVDQFVDANTHAAAGRFAVTEKGTHQLGGREAGFVQAHFPSAAGRWDRVFYFVVVGDFEYRVSCGTRPGPPVIPWDEVAPICELVLNSIQFSG